MVCGVMRVTHVTSERVRGKEGAGHIAGFALINGIRKTDKFDSE